MRAYIGMGHQPQATAADAPSQGGEGVKSGRNADPHVNSSVPSLGKDVVGPREDLFGQGGGELVRPVVCPPAAGQWSMSRTG